MRKKQLLPLFSGGLTTQVILTGCVLLCALTACGKRSNPEPNYTPLPYASEKPTELNED